MCIHNCNQIIRQTDSQRINIYILLNRKLVQFKEEKPNRKSAEMKSTSAVKSNIRMILVIFIFVYFILFSEVEKRESRNSDRRRDDSDREKESKRERA